MANVSKEILKLQGKEGDLKSLVEEYLKIKKVDYEIAKADPDSEVLTIRGISPFIEPGSIMIDHNNGLFILEQLTKVCGASGRFHESGEIRKSFILNKADKILFKTYKGKKKLYIFISLTAIEPMMGLYIGGGEMTIRFNDILKEPSDIPDYDETVEFKCKCDAGKFNCKVHAWDF